MNFGNIELNNTRYLLLQANVFFLASHNFAEQNVHPKSPLENTENYISCAAYSAVNLAFALELTLKGLLLQIRIKPGKGHDLSLLFQKLPHTLKERIYRKIEEGDLYKNSRSVTVHSEDYSFVEKQEEFKNMNTKERIEFILQENRFTFIKFRYLYEFESDYIFIHFPLLTNLTSQLIEIFKEKLIADGAVAINTNPS